MKNQEKKSSTRIERSSKNSFKITKSTFAKALRLVESANMGKLNIPFQNALDEIFAKCKITYNQKEADRYLVQIAIAGEQHAVFVDYIPSKDEFKTLQGETITMGEDFVNMITNMVKKTSYVSPAETDDFNEPLLHQESSTEEPFPEEPVEETPGGDDDFEY